MVVKNFVPGRFSQSWWDYIYRKEREEDNNEGWLCSKCKHYNPFYYDNCYFCGA